MRFTPTVGAYSLAIATVAVYPLYIYCNFSGYIDIVIGIARFLRIQLPENFNRPFSSQNYMIFWSRWHITLSTWFQIYVYGPLCYWTLRRWRSPATEALLNVFAFFLTFFLVGLWHGQTSSFMFFGLLLGLGVSVTKLYQVLMIELDGPRTIYGSWKPLALQYRGSWPHLYVVCVHDALVLVELDAARFLARRSARRKLRSYGSQFLSGLR